MTSTTAHTAFPFLTQHAKQMAHKDNNDALQHKVADLGWKLFFAALMLFQGVGLTLLWRTYDSISATSKIVQTNTFRIDHIILPRLEDHEREISLLIGHKTQYPSIPPTPPPATNGKQDNE